MMHILTIGDKRIMFNPPSGLNYRPKRGMIGRGVIEDLALIGIKINEAQIEELYGSNDILDVDDEAIEEMDTNEYEKYVNDYNEHEKNFRELLSKFLPETTRKKAFNRRNVAGLMNIITEVSEDATSKLKASDIEELNEWLLMAETKPGEFEAMKDLITEPFKIIYRKVHPRAELKSPTLTNIKNLINDILKKAKEKKETIKLPSREKRIIRKVPMSTNVILGAEAVIRPETREQMERRMFNESQRKIDDMGPITKELIKELSLPVTTSIQTLTFRNNVLSGLIPIFLSANPITSLRQLEEDIDDVIDNLKTFLNNVCKFHYGDIQAKVKKYSDDHKKLGYGKSFEMLLQEGPLNNIIHNITNDTSPIIGTDIGSADNSLYNIDPRPYINGMNQREYCVYDLVQLKSVIEIKFYATISFGLNPLKQIVTVSRFRQPINIKGPNSTIIQLEHIPGMPITQTKFIGNKSFIPYFIEANGQIMLYNVMQKDFFTQRDKAFIFKHDGKNVFYFWGTENGLFYYNLTEDIQNNPQDFEKTFETKDGVEVFTIRPNFKEDDDEENFYIPFNRVKLLL